MTLIAHIGPELRIPKNVPASMSKKRRFLGPLEKQDGTHPNIVQICTRAPLSYLLITASAIELQKVSVSVM